MMTRKERKRQNKDIARRKRNKKHSNVQNNNLTLWQRMGL